MIKIDTGSNTVFRFDDMMDADTCDQLCQYALEKLTPKKINSNLMPWHEKETLSWVDIPQPELKNKIRDYRKRAEQLVRDTMNKDVFIEFTDLVVWRTGRKMPRHRDDGYNARDAFRSRKWSSVLYLNDDFEGGETFIKTENGNDYVSKPKKGSYVFYYSDPRNEHGVNTVISGYRVTLPLWFCTDPKMSEDLKLMLAEMTAKFTAGLV